MKRTKESKKAALPGKMAGENSVFDIARKGAWKKEIRRNEEKYRRIFENIQDIYYETTLDGTIIEISPSIAKYSPFERDELIGKSIDEFYVDQTRRKALLQAITENGCVHDFEIQLHEGRESGIAWDCSITATLMPGDKTHPSRIVGSLRDISERKRTEEIMKQREEELSVKSRNLEEVNTALKVLLKQREKDRREIEENVLVNVKSAIWPNLMKLKNGPLTKDQKNCLNVIEKELQDIISPFLHTLSQTCLRLSTQEMRVADFVKSGRTTKEIADILGISMKTVDYHRNNIRRKLGIKNRQTGLATFLLKFS